MNTVTFVTFCACLALTTAHLLAPTAKIIQGPSSRTTLVGPEGSVISAVAPGGQIIHEEHPGYLAYSAPLLHAHALPVSTHYSKYGSHINHGVPSSVAYGGSLGYAHAPVVTGYSGLVAPYAYGHHGVYGGHHHGLYL